MMDDLFDSQFCRVAYLEKDNVVLLAWKKFCCFGDYRRPALFALELLKKNAGSNFVIDARNGFEDEKEDVAWGFQVLLPGMAKTGCQTCVFIVRELPGLEEEIDLWSAEFRKYFAVYKARSYEEAVKIAGRV